MAFVSFFVKSTDRPYHADRTRGSATTGNAVASLAEVTWVSSFDDAAADGRLTDPAVDGLPVGWRFERRDSDSPEWWNPDTYALPHPPSPRGARQTEIRRALKGRHSGIARILRMAKWL